MSTVARARFAIWNHHTQKLSDKTEPIEWRETPRSKQLVGIVPSMVLPGAVKVLRAGGKFIDVELNDGQVDVISAWLANLPSDVMQSTATTDSVIQHSGSYVCLQREYMATQSWPQIGDHVLVRIQAEVSRVGPLRKATVTITDVLCCNSDVAAT